jgi:hypothetical protein
MSITAQMLSLLSEAALSADAQFWSKSYKKAAERIGMGKANADMIAGFKNAYEQWESGRNWEPDPELFVDTIYTGGWSDKHARKRVLDVIAK